MFSLEESGNKREVKRNCISGNNGLSSRPDCFLRTTRKQRKKYILKICFKARLYQCGKQFLDQKSIEQGSPRRGIFFLDYEESV